MSKIMHHLPTLRSSDRSEVGCRSSLAAFTLLELLVVIGLIVALSFVLVSGLAGGGKSAALQSAQSAVSTLVTAARTKAPATNRKTRLLVCIDTGLPDRYLRFLVLQLARQPGSSPVDWDTIQSLSLPDGVYVVPGSLTGLVTDPAQWKRVSDTTEDLVSDIFKNQNLSYAIEGDTGARLWTGIAFTPNGTLAALAGGPPPKGFIVVALGQARAPGTYQAGESPVQLVSPQTVRGLILSAYGVPALLNERNAF
jgi:type II secretory pathway pseudopilin PulG